MARLDVVFGRQATDRGCGAQDRAKELGVARPQAQFDHEQGGVQDLFDVSYCLSDNDGYRGCGEAIGIGEKNRDQQLGYNGGRGLEDTEGLKLHRMSSCADTFSLCVG